MKIYVIFKGHYSDRHIVRIFLDKGRADLYNQIYADAQLEEWDTDDEKWVGKDSNTFYKVELWCGVDKLESGGYSTRIIEEDVEKYDRDEHDYWDYDWELEERITCWGPYFDPDYQAQHKNEIFRIEMVRWFPISEHKSSEEALEHGEKIIFDICTYLESFIEATGDSDIETLRTVVKEMFNGGEDD